VSSEYDFAEKLAFSRGVSACTHPDTIRGLLGLSCVAVNEPSLAMNIAGVDFVATLRRGAKLNIDMKARTKGCSKFWQDGPDFALEIWSVRPHNGSSGKVGWTLDESKITDYTLHVFDPSDTNQAFLMPFQLLRMAFRRNLLDWKAEFSKPDDRDVQSSGKWKSECIFVPACRVLKAITAEMQTTT
jgi:hypothetical protein